MDGVDNDDANFNNIFTITDTNIFVHVVILSTKINQKLSKLLLKGFEWSEYRNEHKTKSGSTNTKLSMDISANQKVNRLKELTDCLY